MVIYRFDLICASFHSNTFIRETESADLAVGKEDIIRFFREQAALGAKDRGELV